MTRQEERERQAGIYIGHPQDLGEDIGITNMRNAFIEGAKWADRTMMERVCNWLKQSEDDYYEYDAWKGTYVNFEHLVVELKKEMENYENT